MVHASFIFPIVAEALSLNLQEVSIRPWSSAEVASKHWEVQQVVKVHC
jgi:hypothetical protein